MRPPRKIRVDLHESKPKAPNPSKGKTHDKPAWICHFCGNSGHIRPNYYKLQAAKRANKPKVLVPQAQDPMVLIGELVKVLILYSNPGVGNHSHVNKNSNDCATSKKFWMQKAQSNCVLLTWSLCFIVILFVTFVLWFLFSLFLRFALHNIHAFHSIFFFFLIFK